jgi:hypothetical protein
MTQRFCVSVYAVLLAAVSSAFAADVQPTDVFTATTRIDTRDWSTEPIALLFPRNFLVGEDELWVAEQRGVLWHVETLTGAKTLVVEEPSPALKNGLGSIVRVGDELVVPVDLVSGNAEFSHTAIHLETGERRGFKSSELTSNLIGLSNGNLLGIGQGSALVIFNVQGETLVKTEAPVFGEPVVRGFARHPDGRVVGIATASDLSGSLLVEVDPETATLSTIATLPGILPTRLAVGPDGKFYAVHREDKDEFTIYKIDGQSFAVSEIPLPEFDFELGLFFEFDVASDGKVLIIIEDRRARRRIEIGYPVILGIDPETFETEIVVGGWGPTMTQPGFSAMGQDKAIYFTGDRGGEHRVLRQDLKTGGITVVTNNSFEGAVLNSTGAIAVHEDDIYVINNAGSPDWEQLVHVDGRTGAQTMLGSFGARLGVQQMMIDPADGSLLMAVLGFTVESNRAILRVVPQANPVFERVNPEPFPGNPMFFDIAPDGSIVFYTTESEGSFIYRVDRDTGSFARIGNRDLPPNYTGPLVVLDDGTIVARGFRDDRTRIVLETIDPVTGAATEVIDTPLGATLLTRMPRGTSGGGNRLSAATGAQAFGDGWYQSDWYGWFNELDQWALHLEHGWQFFGSGSEDSLFVFDFGLNAWLWTRASDYPLLYAFPPRDDWLLYLPGGTADNRWFFSYGQDAWVNVTGTDFTFL